MPNYGDPKYWDKRYEKAQPGQIFEWLEDYDTLQQLIQKYTQKQSVILNLGCGNSALGEIMYDDGYENQYNIDISPIVINMMNERKENRDKLIYQVMDVKDLKFQNNFFDTIIDKSTLDALLCGDQSFIDVALMLNEVSRVLKVGGYYIIISYGTPDNRVFHLQRDNLSFELEIIELVSSDKKSKLQQESQQNDGQNMSKQSTKSYNSPISSVPSIIHYVYILKKKTDADEKRLKNWENVKQQLILEEEKEKEKLLEEQNDEKELEQYESSNDQQIIQNQNNEQYQSDLQNEESMEEQIQKFNQIMLSFENIERQNIKN